ncbi:MAG: MFS transporter [Nocardioidaceae bacterium]
MGAPANPRADEATNNTLLRKVVTASMAGTVVEWYEFFIYGTAATLVFPAVFFPGETAKTGLIYAFSTYAIGFAARPLGGLVFGHFGDKFGRKKLLQLSILMVGVATFLMGCLPTHDQIGFLAPLALVILRFIQGFAVGGEWGGAVLLVAEHSPNSKRAFWSSWPQIGVPMGNLIATIVLLSLYALLDDAQFLSWGWRVAFWLSAVIVFVGWYIRRSVEDAPVFVAARERADTDPPEKLALVTVFKAYPRQVLTGMMLRAGENVLYYIVVTFSITYLKTIGVDTLRILAYVLIGHFVHMFWIPVVGAWGDRIGRKPLYLTGAVLMVGYPFFAFSLWDENMNGEVHVALTVLAITVGLIVHGLMYALQPAMFAELFPTSIRYTGVSIAAQLTSVVTGSVAPLIGVALLGGAPDYDWTPVAIYISIMAVVSVIGALLYRETKGIALTDLDTTEHERVLAERV